MIYKMELSDSVDTMVFDLLEVPIVDKDITGIAENTTIDGNVFNDYLWLKKQYVQKWSIMCQDEYDRLRGFWTRQFGNAEVPFYRLFYGENVYEDKNFLTSDGFTQITNPTERTAPLSLTHLYGNAEQKTLSGKNLWGGFPAQFTNDLNGITFKTNTDGTFSAQGTATGNAWSATLAQATTNNLYVTLDAGTYTKSTADALPTGVFLQSFNADTSTELTGATFTLTETTKIVLRLNVSSGVNISSGITVRPMLEAGSTATAYQEFVGGIPSPNPDYPQEIKTVTGAQTVKITGKNLWSPDNAQAFVTAINNTNQARLDTRDGKSCLYWTAGAGYGSYPTKNFTLDIKFKENTQYAISYDTLKTTTATRTVAIYYTDDTHTRAEDLPSTNTWVHQTIVSDANKTIAYVAPWYSSGESYLDINTLQIEESSQASDYEPYQSQSQTIDLDSIELAKIGTYQDYIWNDDGTWKIHKETQKLKLTSAIDMSGGDLFANYTSLTYFYSKEFDSILPTVSAPNSSSVSSFAMPSTTFYTYSPASFFDGSSLFAWDTGMSTNRLRLAVPTSFVGGSSLTSAQRLTNWRTALGTNDFYIVAPLDTPTDTEITDSELIEQLNHIYELYQGTNNVMLVPSAGAQGEIDGTYRLIYDEETDIIPKTPVVLTLTDGGVINPCGCRQNIQLIMRETEGE